MAVAKRPKKVAHVTCNGGVHSQQRVAEALAAGQDCVAFHAEHPEGNSNCARGCLGLGTCVAACKFGALFLNGNGVAEVIRELCTGCGACLRKCPKDLFVEVERYNTIAMVCANPEKGAVARKQCEVSCTACGLCEKNCPAAAIRVIDFAARIDDAACISCGMCAIKCPRSAIADTNRIIVDIPVLQEQEKEKEPA